MVSQILELRGKSFYIDIHTTTTWNSHFVLLRISMFFLASIIDISPSSFVSQTQTKNRSTIFKQTF